VSVHVASGYCQLGHLTWGLTYLCALFAPFPVKTLSLQDAWVQRKATGESFAVAACGLEALATVELGIVPEAGICAMVSDRSWDC
jgi:hypothetical protein